MATASARGTSVVSTVLTTWANTANAFDGAVGSNPATYTTWVNAARSTVGQITIGGYSFTGPVSGDIIDGVSAAIRHIESSTTLITAVTVQLQTSTGTNIGSAVAATRTTSAHTDNLTLGTPTNAQVLAGLRVLVSITRSNSTTSTTFSLDQVDLTVTYHAPLPAVETFTDDFATQDTAKGTYSGSATVASQQLSIPITFSATTLNQGMDNNYLSVNSYDLTDSSAYVQFVQKPSIATNNAAAGFRLQSTADATDYIDLVWFIDGNLYWEETVNGVQTQGAVAYNATDHAWLRLRNTGGVGGTNFYESSSDGSSWSSITSRTAPAGIDVTTVRLRIYAGYDAGGNVGTLGVPAIWDNLNTPPAAAAATSLNPPVRRPNYGSLLQQ